MRTPYNDMLAWLVDYCKKKRMGKLYKGLELSTEFRQDVERARGAGMEFFIDPMLPIDLVSVRTKVEPSPDNPDETVEVHYYTLFWFVFSVLPSVERLQFYRFYLSRICKLRALKIVIIIPDDIESSLAESLQKIAKEHGLGLWKVDIQQNKPEELCTARHFRQHMEECLRNPPEDMEPLPLSVRRKARRIGPYFDRYVGDAVEAVAGRTITQVGKRYIDRQILDLALKLENVSYAEELKQLVTKHLTDKTDDQQFVIETFRTLWEKYFPKMNYPNFLKVAELPLYNIFASRRKPYRDHHMHQFQVFVLGSAIIDKLISKKHCDITTCPEIDRQWLVASSFHDMAYPLQLYDTWAQEFFEKSLGISSIGVSDIKSYFIDRSLLSRVGFIINALCERHFHTKLEGNWLHKEKELVLFFHDRVTRLKHHCILSSLYLLKEAQELSNDVLYGIFVPASLAIVLHHYGDIWKDYSKNAEPDTAWQKLPEQRKLQSLEFSADPLSFLLMFCDHAQEWGRPKLKYPETEVREEERTFILDKCDITTSRCLVTISAPRLSSIDELFEDKDQELKTLEKFLRRPADCEFGIILVDKDGVPVPHQLKCSDKS